MSLEFEVIQDNVGLNPVRSFGYPLTIMPILLDFSGVENYATGGVEIEKLDNYFNYGEGLFMMIANKDGYIFEYDNNNNKIIVYEGDGTDGIAEVANEGDISSIETVIAMVYGY